MIPQNVTFLIVWWLAGQFRNDCTNQFWSDLGASTCPGHTTLRSTGASQLAELTQVCSPKTGVSFNRPRRIKTKPPPNRRCKEKFQEQLHPPVGQGIFAKHGFRENPKQIERFRHISSYFETFQDILRKLSPLDPKNNINLCFWSPLPLARSISKYLFGDTFEGELKPYSRPTPFLGRLFKEELLLLAILDPKA